MKKVFICHTYYHVLISLLKAINIKDSSDIILSYTWRNNQLLNDDKLIYNLKKSKIFDNVIIGDFMNEELEKIKKNKKLLLLKKYFFIRKFKKNNSFQFNNYDEIYIFNDNSPIGLCLIRSHMYYNLLEDGTDCYINNNSIINQKTSFKKILKKIIGAYQLGESKYAKSIEVNNKNGVFLKNKNIIENSKSKMINSLDENEKKQLIKIFVDCSIIEKLHNSFLIITQPLNEDGILKNEDEKINLYRKIINKFCKNKNVVIKTHPREKTDYKKFFKDCLVIDEVFPLELINYYNEIKIMTAITISSTSINLIENVDNKIILGWNWIEK